MKLKKTKIKRLKNCKILGTNSLAIDVNHTLTTYEQKKELSLIKSNLNKVLKIK